jgi:hypothetical protein
MPDVEAEARAEMEKITEGLKEIRSRLLRLHESLPISPREDVMLLGEEDPDFSTEARSLIECVLHDRIDPAIRDLSI